MTTEELAQSVLAELGSPHQGEGKYFDYLRIQAGNAWNEDNDTHLATLSDQGVIELLFEVEQLVLGPLDGEYGDEVLRPWSPKIRVKDWMASLEMDEAISHRRKLIFGNWGRGLMNLAFRGT